MKKRLVSLVSSGDDHFIEVVRHSVLAMLLLVVTTLIQFVFDIALTRTFDAHGAGIFYLCFSVLMMLALLGRLGMDRAVVQFIPPLLRHKPGAAAGVNSTAIKLSLYLTLPLAVGLFLFAPELAGKGFGSPELTPYLQIFSVAIPGLALNYVLSGSLRALKKTQSSLVIQRTTMYLFGIPVVLIIGNLYGLAWAMAGFVAMIYISTVLAFVFLRRYHPRFESLIPFSKKRMLVTSIPLLFVVFATQMNGQASVLLLGVFGSNADVAIFNVALKISLIMGLILTAINAIAATKISELYAENRQEELRTMVSKISALGLVAGLPLFLALAIFPELWLGLFGDAFLAGASALVVLSAGQLISVAVGSTDFALAMTGHERALAVAVGTSLVINIVLGVLLIPAYGVYGAGIATAVTVAISNIIMVLMVKHYLNAWLLPFRYIKVWFNTLTGKKGDLRS